MRNFTSIGKPILNLSAEDRVRLEVIASWFAIEFWQQKDGGYVLRSSISGSDLEVVLPQETAHKRLLAEVCSRAADWIYFHCDESCRDSLLNNSDARLVRVARLFLRKRNSRNVEPGTQAY